MSIIVTAVIPAYNRPDRLRRAVASLLAQDLDPATYEVMVVDSSPNENNREMVEAMRSEAKCRLECLRKKPEGPGPSRNLGALTGTGPFIAFMDSDCEAAPEWLREGVAAFQSDARIGIVQGKTLPEPGIPHHIFNFYIEVTEESFVYETANIFYRREAFLESGGFSHDLHPDRQKPMGGEDIDLGWRVKKLGWKSTFAERALVYHAVERISFWTWLVLKQLYVFPMLVRKHPELRRFFYGRYFYNEAQALLALAMSGAIAAFWSPLALLLTLPYIVRRSMEPSKTLRGPMRLLRTLIYVPRDVAAFFVLLAGSVRFRALLI